MRTFLTAALVTVALSACGAPAAPAVDVSKGEIRADLKEYQVALTSNTVRAGQVTFLVRNVGGMAHNFVVVKTDAAPDKIPLDTEKQIAKEDGKVGGIDGVAPGKSANLRLDLAPGHYVVMCNIPTHYQLGMRAELTVQ
ncbi:MAG: hypothetical protein KGN00_04480 [Chloroflexota bacterium]|nr:hypothetical protein [Chloroflexota bacterium]MDE3192924.1 hypothetical protein [Chloroflexota bacterium]